MTGLSPGSATNSSHGFSRWLRVLLPWEWQSARPEFTMPPLCAQDHFSSTQPLSQ